MCRTGLTVVHALTEITCKWLKLEICHRAILQLPGRCSPETFQINKLTMTSAY